MPINPQIVVPQVQGIQLENPLNMARNALAIREAQSQIAANQLKTARAQQLKTIFAGQPGEQRDPQTIANALLQAGFPEEAKQIMDFTTSTSQSRKAGLESQAAQFALLGSEAGAFVDDPASLNKESILPWASAAVQRGLLTPEALKRFEALPDDPKVLSAAMRRLQVQALTPVQQLETSVMEQNLGGESRVLRIPKLSGTAEEVAGSRAPVTQSPNRPLTLISNFAPASETIQEEAMKELRDTYKQLKTAKVDIDNLRQAADLAKTSGRKYMGTGGSAFLEGAKFLKNRLGVDVDTSAIVNAETARTALFQNVLNNLRKLDAQPSQEQQRIMQEALGNLNTDPDALESVVRVYEDVIRGRVELHNKSVDESVQSGIKMPYSLRIDLPPPRDKIAPPPPPKAIAELRANPALKKQFDEVFGAGAADRALKGGR